MADRAVIVLFAPGCGGNHVANMLSLGKSWHSRFPGVPSYLPGAGNAHQAEENNITENRIRQPGNQVLCAHLAEYRWHADLIQQRFQHCDFLLIEFARRHRNSVWYNRVCNLYSYAADNYMLEELATIYSAEVVKQIVGTSNLQTIAVGDIFSDQTNALCELVTHYDATTEIDLVRDLHCQWYNFLHV